MSAGDVAHRMTGALGAMQFGAVNNTLQRS